jgi:hypothetical protein
MKRYIFIGFFILSLLAVTAWQQKQIKNIRSERDAYRQNTYALLSEMDSYRTKDSLNAVSLVQMELKLAEVNRYRSQDMRLIETLKVDKKRLQQITTTQTKTEYELKTAIRDSIVYRDRYISDTLHCIDIRDKWFDLQGCIDKNDKFSGRLENRDSLLYVEHIIPKRFLFIKWGCKERRQEIVSKNPYTTITGAEYITLRK